jgi:hypothetical protein
MNERSRELIGYIDVNPKIRELAKRSGCSIDKLGYGEGNLEKFAELIVKECLTLSKSQLVSIPDNQEDWDGHNYGFTAAVCEFEDLVKEHFGVEE